MIFTRIRAKAAAGETEIELEGPDIDIKVKLRGYTLTEEQIKATLETAAGQELADVFIHINRDDSITIATGKAPDFWPEDEPEIE